MDNEQILKSLEEIEDYGKQSSVNKFDILQKLSELIEDLK